MTRKTVNTLEDVNVAELDRAMGKGNGKPHKSERLNAMAKRVVGKKAPKVAKEKAAPRAAFRVHAMAYNDKTKKYGKTELGSFEDLAEVVAVVEKTIERGQENGLHEVSVYIR